MWLWAYRLVLGLCVVFVFGFPVVTNVILIRAGVTAELIPVNVMFLIVWVLLVIRLRKG